MSEQNRGFSITAQQDGRDVRLAMEGLWLTGRVLPVGARLVAVHRFRSAEKRPTEVVYAFGLPRDAALRRFKVVGEDFQVRSELQPVEKAREAYEAGIQRGHLSALSRVYRDGRVNLSLGNIRPGELVKVYLEILAGVNLRDDGYRFRFPFTLAPCYHASARSASVPGGMEMELPAEEFSDLILPPWMNGEERLHRVGFDLSVAWPGGATEVGSPSHRVQALAGLSGVSRLTSAQDGDVPNRDLVVDVKGKPSTVLCYGGEALPTSEDGARSRAFAVALPSTMFGVSEIAPRRVLFLLDRSGSMGGIPVRQAKQALLACLGALEAEDQFNVLAFDCSLESFEDRLVLASDPNRVRAKKFLKGIDGRGGTELGSALCEALRQAGHAGADVFVLTDGQVAATEDIVGAARNQGVRVHCLGIGSASQDRFLAMLAESTGGVSEFVMPRERVDTKALELFASAGRCAGQDVEVHGEGVESLRWIITPKRHVYAGFPLMLWGEALAEGTFTLRLAWKAASEVKETSVACECTPDTNTVRLLQGARLITSIESQCGAELDSLRRAGREAKRWQKKLEEVGREYGLANRALSLVAVVERQGDDASQVPFTRVVPVGLPEDLAPDAYCAGIRLGLVARFQASEDLRGATLSAASPFGRKSFAYNYEGPKRRPISGIVQGKFRHASVRRADSSSFEADSSDPLVELMGELLSDGGLPGPSVEERALRTTAMLAMMRAEDHEKIRDLVRLLTGRVTRFLRSLLRELPQDGGRETVEAVLEMIDQGKKLNDWAVSRVRKIAQGEFPSFTDGWTRLGQAVHSATAP
jgi:Ca-activated chloride channel family protein